MAMFGTETADQERERIARYLNADSETKAEMRREAEATRLAYHAANFRDVESDLQETLQRLYVQNEDHREYYIPEVERHLNICRSLGSMTDIPMPTPIMGEAMQALGILVDN